jgi:hypothetical protein
LSASHSIDDQDEWAISDPEPHFPAMSTPLSSFPFFPMAIFKLINGYGHKSSKSEGVSSSKELSNQWNGTGIVFSSA